MPDFKHFLTAQAPKIATVVAELRAGKKRTHWMWFIFPQIAGLGTSEMSERFAIRSLDEARSYVDHPVLGQRLRDCTQAVLIHGREGQSRSTVHEIFGSPDDRKFYSSMTLFRRADPDEPLFREALRMFFSDVEDQPTIDRIE